MEITGGDALIVVDVQNDFCPGGGLAVPAGDAVIPVILKIAPRFEHILLTQDWHPAGHCSFASSHSGKKPGDVVLVEGREQRLWLDHCIQGTKGAEIHPKLQLDRAELILRKGFRREIDSYSAFFENDQTTPTGLAGFCQERGPGRMFFAGLAYDFCVGFSALDARRVGFEAVVIRDACRGIDVGGSVAAIEREFDRAGVWVVESEEL
ncbi:MAG TPA: bifunctional nicotinamidase/pyrazinamidase [Acidobacteriaceae bacterium]|jgi:nicotinamidase/pyrazinamidase|nr:bifunctional nicotinamidase/pyrazinamidase [Acidobacteriaceae bacterium]